MHFADPDYDEFGEDDYSLAVKDYYLRWLLFLGANNGEASQTDIIKLDLRDFEVAQYDKREFYVQKSSYNNNCLRIPIKYGISKKAFELFNEGDYKALYYLDTKATSLENVEIFSDETIATYSSKLNKSFRLMYTTSA